MREKGNIWISTGTLFHSIYRYIGRERKLLARLSPDFSNAKEVRALLRPHEQEKLEKFMLEHRAKHPLLDVVDRYGVMPLFQAIKAKLEGLQAADPKLETSEHRDLAADIWIMWDTQVRPLLSNKGPTSWGFYLRDARKHRGLTDDHRESSD